MFRSKENYNNIKIITKAKINTTSQWDAFGADSGTVALALATGEATMPIPESVKVTFTGKMCNHMDFRDVVHATQAQMLKQFGDNIFQGKIIEVHLGTLIADQAFTFTDWTAEM